MGAIVIAVIITIAIVAGLLVVSSRLNRRNPKLENYPCKPEGADDVWFTGGPSGG
jgi:hypothetical protein